MQHSLMDWEDLLTMNYQTRQIVWWERLKEVQKCTLPFMHFKTLKKEKSYAMIMALKIFPGASEKVLQPHC